MSIFQSVKEFVTARQAAEQYGVKVNRNGMVCCPFHKDRHPSMKVEKRIEGKRIYCSSWKNLYEISGRKDLWHESRGLVMGVYKEGNWKSFICWKKKPKNRMLEK